MDGSLLSLTDDAGGPESDGCGVGAFGVVQVPQDAFAALRKQPGPDVGKALTPGLLRQADDQAVAGLAAVYYAIHDFGLRDHSFTDWAVAAAPCLLGRSTAVAVLDKYRRLGPRGVSPLVSPFLSLHSVSALISLGLRSHGPNLGVGGGWGAVADGLLAGISVLLEQTLPGVWLVLTGWDPEPGTAASESDAGPAVCHAVALALVPVADRRTGLRLRYLPSARAADPASSGDSPPGVAGLIRFLAAGAGAGRRWPCPIAGGGIVELADAVSLQNILPAAA